MLPFVIFIWDLDAVSLFSIVYLYKITPNNWISSIDGPEICTPRLWTFNIWCKYMISVRCAYLRGFFLILLNFPLFFVSEDLFLGFHIKNLKWQINVKGCREEVWRCALKLTPTSCECLSEVVIILGSSITPREYYCQ